MDERLRPEGCRARRDDLGAYVLGALGPAERAEVEAHLADCPSCRDELATLAGLPGLLSRLSLEEVDPAPELLQPPIERLLGDVARSRRRQRLRLVLAAVASVLVIGGAALALGLHGLGGGDGRHPTVALSSADATTHVSGSLDLAPEPWGTSVALKLAGVPPGTRCWLVALGPGGRREVAGTWRASYDGTASVDGATAIPVAELRGFAVEKGGHRTVLRFSL